MGKANIIMMKPFLVFINYSEMENWSVRYLVSNDFGYNKQYKLFKIGDFLQRNRNTVSIKDDIIYSRVTIKLYTKGVKKRDELKGESIGTKKQYIVNSGQFIISKIDARNGAFGIVPESLQGAITTADFLSYNIDETKINPEFLTLLTSTKQFLAYCQGASSGTTGRQRINEKTFLNASIPLPPLKLQINFVKNYTKTIRLAEEKEKELRKLECAVNKHIYNVLGIQNLEKKERVKGIQFISYSKLILWGIDSDVLKLNKIFLNSKYPLVSLKEICVIGSGGTPSRGIIDYYTGNIPWVKTGEVRENIIVDTQEKITEEAILSSSAKIYPKGSLIVAMYGATAGRTALLGIDAATNQACAVLHQINTNIVNLFFLWYYLETQLDNFKAISSGSAQPNLNAQKISNYKIPLPSLAIQNEVANTVMKMKSEIKTLQQQAEENRKSALEDFEKAIFQ